MRSHAGLWTYKPVLRHTQAWTYMNPSNGKDKSVVFTYTSKCSQSLKKNKKQGQKTSTTGNTKTQTQGERQIFLKHLMFAFKNIFWEVFEWKYKTKKAQNNYVCLQNVCCIVGVHLHGSFNAAHLHFTARFDFYHQRTTVREGCHVPQVCVRVLSTQLFNRCGEKSCWWTQEMKMTEKVKTNVHINKAAEQRRSDGRRKRQKVIIPHYIQYGSVEHICTGTDSPLDYIYSYPAWYFCYFLHSCTPGVDAFCID